MKNEFKEEETIFINKIYKHTTIMQILMLYYPYFYGTSSTWPGVK